MIFVHYFKDIRQGVLQSDCIMLFGGARVLGLGMTLSWERLFGV